ncbi:MAG TPA: hypothetical protein VF175_05690 [Lacipirellula sp.]
MENEGCSTARVPVSEEQARQVRRFEQLVYENSDRLRRIELLLEEIAAEDKPVKNGRDRRPVHSVL